MLLVPPVGCQPVPQQCNSDKRSPLLPTISPRFNLFQKYNSQDLATPCSFNSQHGRMVRRPTLWLPHTRSGCTISNMANRTSPSIACGAHPTLLTNPLSCPLLVPGSLHPCSRELPPRPRLRQRPKPCVTLRSLERRSLPRVRPGHTADDHEQGRLQQRIAARPG